jgi:hypothetical protein
MWMRDPGSGKEIYVSGIRDKHPATLPRTRIEEGNEILNDEITYIAKLTKKASFLKKFGL